MRDGKLVGQRIRNPVLLMDLRVNNDIHFIVRARRDGNDRGLLPKTQRTDSQESQRAVQNAAFQRHLSLVCGILNPIR